MTRIAMSDAAHLVVDDGYPDDVTPLDVGYQRDPGDYPRDFLRRLEVEAEMRSLAPEPWWPIALMAAQWHRVATWRSHSWRRELRAHATGAEREALLAPGRERAAEYRASRSDAQKVRDTAVKVAWERRRLASDPEYLERRRQQARDYQRRKAAQLSPEQLEERRRKERERYAALRAQGPRPLAKVQP